MAFADPTSYSKGQINRAGAAVRARTYTDDDLELINRWRASHAYILNTFQATLRNRTRRTQIYVAQRLKRLRTIIGKLDRQAKMELARMDDIAGCRLIFPDEASLRKFRRSIHRARFSHKLRNQIDKYDYIEAPKADGYRGIHDIYEYNVNSETGKSYNGLLLELQYRTVFQHAWATTVEIVGMITENQPKFHAGDRRHIEFFKYASEIISRAYENETSCFPDLSNKDVVRKFRKLDREIRILSMLRGLNASQERIGKRRNVILQYSDEGVLSLQTYEKGRDALRRYFLLEQQQKASDVVLVRADTADEIRLAYTNYFSDPDDFIKYIERGCERLSRTPKPKRKKRKAGVKRKRR
jgi:hypothetical protein